jgi:hypothetical protein
MMFGDSVPNSQETHYISIVKINQLLLFKEITIYCMNHTKHVITVCEKTVRFNIKLNGVYSNCSTLDHVKVKKLCLSRLVIVLKKYIFFILHNLVSKFNITHSKKHVLSYCILTYEFLCNIVAPSLLCVQWSEFLATDPEVWVHSAS